MTDKTTVPAGVVSSTELGAVGWRYVPSEVWGDQVLTQDPKAAQLAREFGRDVEPLYTEAQLLARVAAERDRLLYALTRHGYNPSSIFRSFYPSATGDWVDLRELRKLLEPNTAAQRLPTGTTD